MSTRRPTRHLTLPNNGLNGAAATIEHDGVVVIVGANGSGKTRLGAWLESPAALAPQVHPGAAVARSGYRIGAQRLLEMPDTAQLKMRAEAENDLLNGGSGPMGPRPSRVTGDPIVGQLSDFKQLVDLLFAEVADVAMDRYIGQQQGSVPGEASPDTLDRLQELWQRIFTERRLVIDKKLRIVRTEPCGSGEPYSPSQMSDGERVGFYLVGHALLAPSGSVVIVDEPELHLHESIQAAIWDALQEARPDCSFVYITHCLSFAASRIGAPKVVLLDYAKGIRSDSPGEWRWMLAERSDEIPEDVTLRILGSRRRTLFVEGVSGGRDQQLYERLFPELHIVPSGGAQSVIRAVQSLTNQMRLLHIVPHGLIDRDDRDHSELRSLEDRNIYALPVAGVENVLLLPECIHALAATRIAHQNASARTEIPASAPVGSASSAYPDSAIRVQALVECAMSRVVKRAGVLRDRAISKRAWWAVRRELSSVKPRGTSADDLCAALADAVKKVDPAALHQESSNYIDSALAIPSAQERYHAVLRTLRNKALLDAAAGAFRLNVAQFETCIYHEISSNRALRESLRRRIEGVTRFATAQPIAAAYTEQQSDGRDARDGFADASVGGPLGHQNPYARDSSGLAV